MRVITAQLVEENARRNTHSRDLQALQAEVKQLEYRERDAKHHLENAITSQKQSEEEVARMKTLLAEVKQQTPVLISFEEARIEKLEKEAQSLRTQTEELQRLPETWSDFGIPQIVNSL